MLDVVFTIPFNNITYVCWRDENNTPKYRPLSKEEDQEYFTSKDPTQVLLKLIKA
jgi:hypothetical protein